MWATCRRLLMIWKLLRPFDWLLELVMEKTKPRQDEPRRDRPLFTHPAWLRLTDTGPLGEYVAKKEGKP